MGWMNRICLDVIVPPQQPVSSSEMDPIRASPVRSRLSQGTGLKSHTGALHQILPSLALLETAQVKDGCDWGMICHVHPLNKDPHGIKAAQPTRCRSSPHMTNQSNLKRLGATTDPQAA